MVLCDHRGLLDALKNSVGDNLLGVLRLLLKMFKKEQEFLSRFQRSNPHAILYLALDAVISVTVVLGGYQLFWSHSSSIESKEQMEVSAVSSDALISLATREKMDAYWLGPVSAHTYTLNDQQRGIVDIFYWPASTGSRDAKNFLYEVKTYKDRKTWDAHTHTILAVANTSTISVKKGVSIKINRASMKGVIATFADRKEILAIAYPVPQTLDSMIKNVESLRLVR